MKAAVQPSTAGTLAAWAVVLAGVSAALHMAKLMPALPMVQRDLGLSLVQAGFLLSTWQVAGMLLGLVMGLAADGLGAKRSVLTGFAVLISTSALVEQAQTASVLIAFRALEGFGFLLVVTPAPGLIRRLVLPGRLDAMMGIWSSYMPLATALALLGGPFVMQWSGWRFWWWTLALVSLCFALAVWRLVPPDPRRHGQQRGSSMMQKTRLTLSHPGPWLVALAFAAYSSQWGAVIGFLPTIYAGAKVATGTAAALTSLAAAVNIVGNVVAGRLLARGYRPQHLLYAGYAAMGLAAVLAFADIGTVFGMQGAAFVRYAAILVFSMLGGIIPGTLFSLAVRFAPNDGTVSTTVGWMQQWSSIGQFAGPPLVALLASRLGGWQWTWAATASCAGFGLVLARIIAQQLTPQAQRRPEL